MNNNVAILKNLSWRSIPSKIGDLGKANLPFDMTVGEALSLINIPIILDGDEYSIGNIQSYKNNLVITAFPANSNNGNGVRSMQVS